jgi:general secretion pathway protein G
MPVHRVQARVARGAGGQWRPFGRSRGMTLLELLLAAALAAVLLVIAVPSYSSYVDKVKVATAESDITRIEAAIQLYQSTNQQLPTSLAQVGYATLLDPWGHPYQYLDFTGLKGKGQMRKDRNLVPINSQYDLYSMGKDGATVPPLTAKVSQDDIILAGDGAYIGLASGY